MDVLATPTGPSTWGLKDRLGRKLGAITKVEVGGLRIEPEPDQLAGINTGPFASLDLAMSAIERHTKGACQVIGTWDR